MHTSLYSMFSPESASQGRLGAIETPHGRNWNLDQLDQYLPRLASCLAQLGARPGDRVCAQVERSPEAIALFLACLRGGIVYVPVNPALTPAEAAHYIEDCE